MRARSFTILLALTLLPVVGCDSNERRAEQAVREFHLHLSQDRADLIYANASEFLRAHMTEAELRKSLSETRGLGAFQETDRAHYLRTNVPGGQEIITSIHNSRFARAACVESFSWHVEANTLKLSTYSCAPNMQVTCTNALLGTRCETTPVPLSASAGTR
jgi:hypothetical protein